MKNLYLVLASSMVISLHANVPQPTTKTITFYVENGTAHEKKVTLKPEVESPAFPPVHMTLPRKTIGVLEHEKMQAGMYDLSAQKPGLPKHHIPVTVSQQDTEKWLPVAYYYKLNDDGIEQVVNKKRQEAMAKRARKNKNTVRLEVE